MSARRPRGPVGHPARNVVATRTGRIERLNAAVAIASKTPAALAFVGKRVARAGPAASFEELQKLGLASCNPLTLLNVFRRALRHGDVNQARAAQNALLKHPSGLPVKHPCDIPLMPWQTLGGRPGPSGRFLFVSGVARSGTTAMGRLLGSHPHVALYTELFLPQYGYVPAMLATENIRLLAEKGLIGLNQGNASVLGKSEQCGVVGDKRPGFLLSAELTLPNFAGQRLKVVHIVRNVYDVAASHQKQFEAGSWTKDFQAAVKAGNQSNRLALSLLAGPHRNCFVIVDYDRFWYSEKNLRNAFGHIDLDSAGIKDGAIDGFVRVARTRLTQDQCRLTAEQRSYIDRHYDFDSERELKLRMPLDLARDADDP
jgi:hypothetical protein